jgi:hypothetical protein
MAISFIGSATAVGDSVTLPSHQAGDLIVVFAVSNNNLVTEPVDYEVVGNGGPSMNAAMGYKIAANGSEVSGTWTNSQVIIAAIYRSSDKVLTAGTTVRAGSASSSSISYGSLPGDQFLNSWVIACGAAENSTATVGTAPSGMTNRTTVTDGTSNLAAGLHDTNATVTSWSTQSAALGVTINNTYQVLQISEVTSYLSSGGGARIPNIRGGADQ